MKRRDWLLAALSSSAALWGARPRYGGTLRVYPSVPAVDREPFTRLTTSTSADASRKTWRFLLRPNVQLQGNTPWTPIYAVERIKTAWPGLNVTSSGPLTVVVSTDAVAP